METQPRKPDPTDASDDEWAFAAPSLALMRPDAPPRRHNPREVDNAVRRIVRMGAQWRMRPTDFPPWEAGSQQARRRIAAGRFGDLVHDLRAVLRGADGRADDPTAAIRDGRTVQSGPERGARAGGDGHKRRQGSQIRLAVDTLGPLLALRVTPANEQERDRVGAPAAAVQAATGEQGEVAFVDQGSTGDAPAAAAAAHGIRVAVVGLPEAKRGFVLLPRRSGGERSFAWAARCRRLARDHERLPETVEGRHFLAFACPMLHRLVSPVATRACLATHWPSQIMSAATTTIAR